MQNLSKRNNSVGLGKSEPKSWFLSSEYSVSDFTCDRKRKGGMPLLPGVSRCVVYVCFWLRRGLPQTATLNTAVRLSTTLQYFNILLRESPKKTIKCKRLRTDKWASFQKWSSVDPILIWLFKVFFEWLPASTVTRPVPRQDLAMRPARCLWLRGNSPAPPPPQTFVCISI